MRIINSASYSDDDFSDDGPEDDNYENDWPHNRAQDNCLVPQHNNPYRRLIRRGATIDVRDDDGFWYAAEIKKIDRQQHRMFVSFPESGDMWDKWVAITKLNTAPLYTHTYDENGNFKVGQVIEVCIDQHQEIWKGAVISEVHPRGIKVTYHQNSRNPEEWIISPRNRCRPYRHLRPAMAPGYRRWKVPPGAAVGRDVTNLQRTQGSHYEGESKMGFNEGKGADDARTRQIDAMSDRYSHYKATLESNNLHVRPVTGDGNCLFRAVAHQVYGDEELHALVRSQCMDYMEAESLFFSQFVEGGREAFPQYLAAKRLSGCWGDDPEIQALCEIYDRPAEIWAYEPQRGARKLRTFHEAAGGNDGGLGAGQAASSHNNQAASTAPSAAVSAVPSPMNTYRDNMNSARTQPPPQSVQHAAMMNAFFTSRPSMKLSYYGGGHYDSLVDELHMRNLLETPPGMQEERAVQRAKARVRLEQQLAEASRSVNANADVAAGGARTAARGSGAGGEGGIEVARRQSDVEGTERAALDFAIQVSRNEHLGWASEDLDTALLMALDEESRALKRGTSGLAMDTSGNLITSSSDSKITTPSGIRLSGISNYGGSPMTSAKKPSFSQPVDSARPAGVVGDSGVTTTTATTAAAATAAHTAVPLSGEALADSAADIAAAQRDLLKTVQDQSEREFLDKAILGSLQDDSKVTEDDLLEQARQASLREADEAALVAATAAISREETDMSRLETHHEEPNSEIDLAMKYSNMSEDELLKLAIEQSRSQSYTNATSHTVQSSSSKVSEIHSQNSQQHQQQAIMSASDSVSVSSSITHGMGTTAASAAGGAGAGAGAGDAGLYGSMLDMNMDEDAMLQAALQASLTGGAQGAGAGAPAYRNNNGLGSSRNGSGASEEPFQSSLAEQGPESEGHTNRSAANTMRDSSSAAGPAVDEDYEDEELRLAIAESLRQH